MEFEWATGIRVLGGSCTVGGPGVLSGIINVPGIGDDGRQGERVDDVVLMSEAGGDACGSCIEFDNELPKAIVDTAIRGQGTEGGGFAACAGSAVGVIHPTVFGRFVDKGDCG